MAFKQLTRWKDLISGYFADGSRDQVRETQNNGRSKSRNRLVRRSAAVSAAGLHCNRQSLTSESRQNVSYSFPGPEQPRRPHSRLSSLKRWSTVPSTSRSKPKRLSKFEASPVEDFDLDENYQKAVKKARRKLVRKSTLTTSSSPKQAGKNPVTGLNDEKLYQANQSMPVSLSISTNVPRLNRTQSVYTDSSFISSTNDLPRSASSHASQRTSCFGRENHPSPNTPLTCMSSSSLPCDMRSSTSLSTVVPEVPREIPYRGRLSRPISYADLRTSLTPVEQEEFFSSASELHLPSSLYPPRASGVYDNYYYLEPDTDLRSVELAEQNDVLRQIPSPEQRVRRTPTTTNYRPYRPGGTTKRHARSKSDPHMLDQFCSQIPPRPIGPSRPQSMVSLQQPYPPVYQYQPYSHPAYQFPNRPQSASSERTFRVQP